MITPHFFKLPASPGPCLQNKPFVSGWQVRYGEIDKSGVRWCAKRATFLIFVSFFVLEKEKGKRLTLL
jgi:hypothetical protein